MQGWDSLKNGHAGAERVCPAESLVFVGNVSSERDRISDAAKARDEAPSGEDVVPPLLSGVGVQPRVALQPSALADKDRMTARS